MTNTSPNTEDYAVVITPKGERFREESLATKWQGAKRAFVRAIHLIRLDLKQQAFGLSFGHLWLVLEPALQAGAYYFLLTVVFAMRGSDATFAFFFVAITFWRSHAALVSSAPTFLTTKGHQYIEQGFGLSIGLLEFASQEILLFLIRFGVLIFFLVVAGYTPHVSWLFALYIGVCMFIFSLSISIWLAIAGTLFRDIGKLVGHAVWLWWYLSPGLYSIKRVPEWAAPIFTFNPFSYIIPGLHSSLLDHEVKSAHVINNTLIALLSALVLYAGWRFLKRFSYVIARYV